MERARNPVIRLSTRTSSDCWLLPTGLSLYSPRKTFYSNNCTLVRAASDQFLLVTRFDLKGNLCPIRMNDASGASHPRAHRRGRKMTQLNLDADGAFVSFQKGLQSLASRPFHDAHQIWCAQDGRHSGVGEFNGVFLFDDKLHLTGRADLRN